MCDTIDAQSKCAVCQRTVYAAEYVGATGRAFHKACFRCGVCKTLLRADTFTTVDGKFYCKPHYEQQFKLAGNYSALFGLYDIYFISKIQSVHLK